jgi:dinuclear metal center YbgI/SA1388 family protein
MTTSALEDVVRFLDELLSVATNDEPEQSNGLIVRGGAHVRRVAAAVNTSFETIEAAAALEADLLLVHHRSWPSIDLTLAAEKEALLVRKGISLYCAHSSLDCAPEFGNADQLAKRLDVSITGRFAEYYGGKAGVLGTRSGTFAELVRRIESVLHVKPEHRQNSTHFGNVAILTGAGGRTNWMDEAQGLGADTYVTGEGGFYPKLFARERGMNLILATHYATEKFGVQALAEKLSDKFGLPSSFLVETDDIL